jgi:hypothetical protein
MKTILILAVLAVQQPTRPITFMESEVVFNAMWSDQEEQKERPFMSYDEDGTVVFSAKLRR